MELVCVEGLGASLRAERLEAFKECGCDRRGGSFVGGGGKEPFVVDEVGGAEGSLS